MLRDVRALLEQVRDLERIIARLEGAGGNARDLRALGQSLAMLPEIRSRLAQVVVPAVRDLANNIEPQPELVALIDRAITDEPPDKRRDVPHHAPLDGVRTAAATGRDWLWNIRPANSTCYQDFENPAVGLALMSKFPGQCGSAAKQTLVNAGRFITPELRGAESRRRINAIILGKVFTDVRIPRSDHLRHPAAAMRLAMGALASLLTCDSCITACYHRRGAVAIRHPVVEQVLEGERFVPNDVLLDGGANRLHIITGPNMAGKSTYIRQVALIVIMAQMGSFVPAASAEIGVVDRVFTRVGAGDDLARGRSTFMVEMQETANILNNAGKRSLVILDEIGRGTSTFDGISIAWAVAEYLHDKIGARALFATHYHELTDLAKTMSGVKNYNVLAREQGDGVVFLRKIMPGGADKSYGIHVGRLAGLPPEVVERASEILLNLEEGELGEAGQPKLAVRRPRKINIDRLQLTLFE